MRIAFYAPFKPLGHMHPSGDLTIARGLVTFLGDQGHQIEIQSDLRTRWIYVKPWKWFSFFLAFFKCVLHLHKSRPDLWLTYHTYYKAPDILGPLVCHILGIKYVIFQGIYSTKRKRRFKTFIGFYLNRFALLKADQIITNKQVDLRNLKRIIPQEKLTYARPSIQPKAFKRDPFFAKENKKKWSLPQTPIILSAAMFRDDVKTLGLAWLIECCQELIKLNVKFHLVIAGAGKMEEKLKDLALTFIPDHFTFVGKIPRNQMVEFYSCGDIFAFPGIREALGMVYLEAQSSSLPIVAFKNGGIPEVVSENETGFLLPMYDKKAFANTLRQLLINDDLRKRMGNNARVYVKRFHDIDKNYSIVEQTLKKVIG